MFKVLHDDDTYICHLQETDGRAYFHVKVKKQLTLSEIKYARKQFINIKKEVEDMGYERLYAITPSPHFAKLLGGDFELIDSVIFEDKPLEIIVWELKQH